MKEVQESSPTLRTILMVEKALQKNSMITIAELKKELPRQVHHTTLMTILEYLEKSNKIAISLRGMTWVHNPSQKLRKAVEHGYEV